MIPHKHAALIKAWADGAKIQAFSPICQVWRTVSDECLAWSCPNTQFRVEPPPNCVRYGCVMALSNGHVKPTKWYVGPEDCHIKATFDGETHKLIAVEVI